MSISTCRDSCPSFCLLLASAIDTLTNNPQGAQCTLTKNHHMNPISIYMHACMHACMHIYIYSSLYLYLYLYLNIQYFIPTSEVSSYAKTL